MAFVAVIMLVAAIGGPQRLRAYAQGDGGCSASTRIPMPDALERARAATLCLINRERAAHGLPALALDARLTQASQLHADDMGKRNFYDHTNPDGLQPAARVYAQGLPPHGTTVAENIHWGTGWLGTPREIMRDWMNSPGHRRNILRAEVSHVGLGIGFDAPKPGHRGQARVYATNFFGSDDAAAAGAP
jgi:uncharacterized protein YkwD